ncbi:MAG: dihydropteroate synthase [bacterium]|nr:dihydropteroate synthase [bacterium]
MRREPAQRWRVRGRELDVGRGVVMGILNVTPDSFYDGGRYVDASRALAHARELMGEGAVIVDVGGESTRPGARPVAVEEELKRVLPVIEGLAGESEVVISVDTRHAEVAEQALRAGAHIVNDVSALADEGMAQVVAQYGAGVILMHMHGTPETMQDTPLQAGEVVREVKDFLAVRLKKAVERGIKKDALAVDPGIGFGKTFEANERLLAELEEFLEFGVPVVVGVSRKRFIGARTGREVQDRLAGSLAAAVLAYERGARVLRVHDVSATCDALRVADAILQAGKGGSQEQR